MASGLGLSCIHGRDIPSNNQNENLPARAGKSRKINSEGDAGSSSSNNCFVALVKASNLEEDALYLPQDLTRSNGFSSNCKKIVLTDRGARSWELDLRFQKSSDSFSISRGWRSFCGEIGKMPGQVITFELERIQERPLLVFCPTDRAHLGDKETENRFATLNLSKDSMNRNRLYLHLSFLKANGMDKLKMVTLIGYDGVRRIVNVLCETSGRMSLGKGWKEFATSNKLVIGQSFTLEAVLTNETHMLRLCASTKLRRKQTKKDKSNVQERGESSSRFVTIEFRPEDVKASHLCLPSEFLKDNGINKLGKIHLLGKDNMKLSAYILETDGLVALGGSWTRFCEDNGVMTGDSFNLQFVCEDEDKIPTFKFCPISRD